MSDRETEIEELGGLIADERDKFPRRSDDMDSDELAAIILSSDWLARVKAEAWDEGWRSGKSAAQWVNPVPRKPLPGEVMPGNNEKDEEMRCKNCARPVKGPAKLLKNSTEGPFDD